MFMVYQGVRVCPTANFVFFILIMRLFINSPDHHIFIHCHLCFTLSDDILLRKAKTRLDLVDLSLALWSGLADSLGRCSSLCAGETKRVSLLFNNTEKSCKIFNLLHTLDDSTDETDLEYYLIERASNRRCEYSSLLQLKLWPLNHSTRNIYRS